ncbi:MULTISPECIES: DUF3995 domain-containing protein [Sphingobacterium]|uniref:DUF3995 domain-containing protein n=1 Tax=Sphingobacterium populi TaxID=1812824 RepID=A0ABW5UCG1_9SPHI|nr:DUF3995 domain-containing protein [Sphingobacterium sp. CFCC 11742]
MVQLSKALLTLIFAGIGAIHFYWAFGGVWAKQLAIPTTQNGVPLLAPGFSDCVLVGLFFAALLLLNTMAVSKFMSLLLERIVWVIIAFIFLARAVGDFQYVGLFKQVKDTTFAYHDNLYFTPLCLFVFSLIVVKLFVR